MNPRRSALALTGAAVLVAAVPATAAASPAHGAVPPGHAAAPAAADVQAQGANGADEGLFGEGDPAADGVWRQSVALLAQDAAGYTPANSAVAWLLDQQCEDGSFLTHRPNPDEPCADVTAADTNATALATQALVALGGHDEAAARAVTWLRSVQNEDGGWSYNPGGATDANSTAVVVGALATAGEDPDEVRRDGASPHDALAGLQLGCDADEADRGAFAWQPDEDSGDLHGSPMATADAVLAGYGSGLVVDPDVEGPATPESPLDCGGDAEAPEDAAEETEETSEGATEDGADGDAAEEGADGQEDGTDAEDGADAQDGEESAEPAPGTEYAAAGAAQLAALLADGDDHLVSQLTPEDDEAQPDYGTTAKAVLALAAGGHQESAQSTLSWLAEQHGGWTGYADNPTAVGTLVLAARAADANPEDFGGTDLLAQLVALGPTPEEAPEDANGSADGEESDGDGDGGAVLWVLGACLLVGVGVGFWLSMRRGRKDS